MIYQREYEQTLDEISNLETKVEYISVSSEFYEIQVGDNVVLVEKADEDR